MIKIDIKLLERIAEYYEFPMAVFFSNTKAFKGKTRIESKLKKIKEFEKKLKELMEDYFGD